VGVHALSHMRLSNSMALFHPFWFANDLHIAPSTRCSLSRPYSSSDCCFAGAVIASSFSGRCCPDCRILVKGDNDPAGGVYDWLLCTYPGFRSFVIPPSSISL
jgi:hypothetical protein